MAEHAFIQRKHIIIETRAEKGKHQTPQDLRVHYVFFPRPFAGTGGLLRICSAYRAPLAHEFLRPAAGELQHPSWPRTAGPCGGWTAVMALSLNHWLTTSGVMGFGCHDPQPLVSGFVHFEVILDCSNLVLPQ